MDSCNIKVAIKARPLNHKEQLDDRVYWKIESDSVIHIDPITKKKNGEQFFFDRVFCDKSTNYDVFDDIVRPIIDRGVQGFNGTVFAYGQTGSGKTFTMSGDQSNPGIIPLAINYMFNAMNNSSSREYLLRACYLEIYNEKVIDLLEKKNNKNQPKKIEIQKDGLHITPLKAIVCQNSQMVIDLMKIGEKNRSIGETDMNERSSRSHTIFRMILESRNVDDDCDGAYQQSVINLVDLAGSERSSQTQSSMERFKEGCKINSSLTTLSLVIQQLSECPDSSQHVNFRDSKLTRILQTSLGGNSLTAIICTVTLAVEDQTSNTLSFASRAKKIKNTAKVNENVTDETLLKRYRVQLSKLNKELEGIKQNQFENDEVNEIKYKYQEEKRTNEELKERIMRLQNNMITSAAHTDQPPNKKGYQRRRTWGGKLDNTFSSNSILETIEEDVNMHRPSVPPNFGNLNKDFKTPLEPFEWDLIREEDRSAVTESINNENTEHHFSPPSNICETPKKVLRERVNNYKNMFEMSMKENNELREFTTLEKQMFHNNNEQLKDLSNLRKQVENLLTEKNESEKMIEKLKFSIKVVEHEKRDIEVIMEVQKDKYNKREIELLATIQETREELQLKEDQIKKTILSDNFMTEKQEEIKRLEMKIKEMYQLNNTYINEIDTLKLQLLNKDQQLKAESSKQCSLLNELSLLQNAAVEVKSVPCTIKFLADEGYFTLRKCEILELDQLLEHIHSTVEKLQLENQSLIDENNNLKLITSEFNIQMKTIKEENNDLRFKLNSIEEYIKSTIKDFSKSSEINVDNSDTNSLIDFAVKHFEENTNSVNILSNKNLILEEKLSLSNIKLCEIKSFVFNNLDCILQNISVMELESSTEMEKFKKQLSETIDENLFLKSSIQAFNKLTFECVDIIEQVKTNHSKIAYLQEELTVCNAVKNELQVQNEDLNKLNAYLNTFIDNQTKVENEIKENLVDKYIDLNDAHSKIDEMQLMIKDNEIKTESNVIVLNQLRSELETVKSDLEDKSNMIVELEETKLELLSKCSELEKSKPNAKYIDEKEEIEKKLQDELVTKTNGLQEALKELKEMNIKLELNDSEIDKLKTSLSLVVSELGEKLKLIENENFKSELIQNKELEETSHLSIINSTLALKPDYENEIHTELLIKTKELGNAVSQVNLLQLTIEEMKTKTISDYTTIERLNNELDTVKSKLGENSKVMDEFKINKSEETMCYGLETISELNGIITKLKSELDNKLNNEKALKNELQNVTIELDDATSKVDEVKSVINILNIKHESYISIVEQLNYELKCIKTTLNEKTELIFELENTNLELSTKCKNSKDAINKTITDLKLNLEDKIKVENELRDELQSKTIALDHAMSQEKNYQIKLESIENELKSNAVVLDKLIFDLDMKSNVISKLENINSELILKCDKINETMLNNLKDNELTYLDIQCQLQQVHQEKSLIQTDLNLVSQKFMELSEHHDETKIILENKVKLQVLNYHKLYTEFINLSCDIESLLKRQSTEELNLREEILLKSTELEQLQKQVLESSLQHEYDRLEEEYMLRSRECDEAREKITNFESILSRNQETEKILKNNLESKCIALEEYKKNVEFLFSRNDSFQVRVNDFEDNVLVDLNDEFDLMKSELSKKTENENILIEEKANLECNLDRLQEKLTNVTKEMELSEERCEDLASIINVLVIEIKDANSVKQNLEMCLNEAEYDLIKSGDFCENLKFELYSVQRELENACINAECVEKDLQNLKFKLDDKNDKNELNGCDVRNKLIDPLVDYVHDIKLKLTELNSAIISGNQSEKRLRTKVLSAEDDILPHEHTLKINCGSQSDSTDIDIGLEIDNLHKVLNEKNDLINDLQTAKNDMEKNISELQCQMKKQSDEKNDLINSLQTAKNDMEKNIAELQCQIKKQSDEKNDLINGLQTAKNDMEKIIAELQCQMKKQSDENNKYVNEITLVENDLKEKTLLIRNLNDELNDLKIQYNKLEEHNQANKEQIYYSYDIDSELRNGKRNIINEINLLEPGKITGVLTDHNLSNLLDMFVSLIMTKEQQIVTDLVNDHNKVKRLYEDQIKQFQEDIKKGKEWQEQVENDNEKLGLELENLKSQIHNFPSRELKIKELTEKVLEAENLSFNYLNELEELKTQLTKKSEHNYQSLSNEFETFKTNSELSIQDLKNKLENLTKQYNESLIMYKDQKDCCYSLEDKIEIIQSECACLKSVIDKKDEDIKNLLDGFQLKTKEYETLIEKYSLQKEETKTHHEKIINELELDLSNIKHQMYCTEKLLKEVKKNNQQLLEENSLNVSKIKQMQENYNSAVRIAELEGGSQITKISNTKLENLEKELNVKNIKLESLESDLRVKTTKLEETEEQCSKLVHALETHVVKNNEFEKQLESLSKISKIKDDEIENYQIKLKMNENSLIEVNNVTEKLRKILKCDGTLSTLYDNVCSLITKCEDLEEESNELKQSNADLDNECESMLEEIKSKDDKIAELLTQLDELKQNIVLLTEERDFLKSKSEQFKNFNDDVKKLNEEIFSYEQNIYQLRKDKGQLIVQHDKELKQLKNELNQIQTKNLELSTEYSKLSETTKILEKSLKEDIQQLNRCIVDKNAKISTLELFSKTNTDDLKKKNHELENIFKRARDENNMLRRELRRLKEITNVTKVDQFTQTAEEQSLVSSAIVADHKIMIEKIAKFEKDSKMMKMMLHHRKAKIEELEKQLNERHG